MVAQQFDQVTYIARDKIIFRIRNPYIQIFVISGFKIVLMFLRQLNFGVLLVEQLFFIYYKGKTPLFCDLQFLLLLSERWLSPESCLAVCHSRSSCLYTGCSLKNLTAFGNAIAIATNLQSSRGKVIAFVFISKNIVFL